MVVMNIRSAITAESTLSFLGIGLPIEVVSWGSMLSLSEKALLTDAWWIIVIPGVFLVATLLCITELANAMRPLDPRTHAIKKFGTIGCRRWSQSFYFCSGKSRTMACAAAACSARFLLVPEPVPTSLPLSRTRTLNSLQWSGPVSEMSS